MIINKTLNNVVIIKKLKDFSSKTKTLFGTLVSFNVNKSKSIDLSWVPLEVIIKQFGLLNCCAKSNPF